MPVTLVDWDDPEVQEEIRRRAREEDLRTGLTALTPAPKAPVPSYEPRLGAPAAAGPRIEAWEPPLEGARFERAPARLTGAGWQEAPLVPAGAVPTVPREAPLTLGPHPVAPGVPLPSVPIGRPGLVPPLSGSAERYGPAAESWAGPGVPPAFPEEIAARDAAIAAGQLPPARLPSGAAPAPPPAAVEAAVPPGETVWLRSMTGDWMQRADGSYYFRPRSERAGYFDRVPGGLREGEGAGRGSFITAGAFPRGPQTAEEKAPSETATEARRAREREIEGLYPAQIAALDTAKARRKQAAEAEAAMYAAFPAPTQAALRHNAQMRDRDIAAARTPKDKQKVLEKYAGKESEIIKAGAQIQGRAEEAEANRAMRERLGRAQDDRIRELGADKAELQRELLERKEQGLDTRALEDRVAKKEAQVARLEAEKERWEGEEKGRTERHAATLAQNERMAKERLSAASLRAAAQGERDKANFVGRVVAAAAGAVPPLSITDATEKALAAWAEIATGRKQAARDAIRRGAPLGEIKDLLRLLPPNEREAVVQESESGEMAGAGLAAEGD